MIQKEMNRTPIKSHSKLWWIWQAYESRDLAGVVFYFRKKKWLAQMWIADLGMTMETYCFKYDMKGESMQAVLTLEETVSGVASIADLAKIQIEHRRASGETCPPNSAYVHFCNPHTACKSQLTWSACLLNISSSIKQAHYFYVNNWLSLPNDQCGSNTYLKYRRFRSVLHSYFVTV